MAVKLEKDLSQGNVAKQLFFFSLPFLLSNLIQSLYNVADMIIVGQFGGPVQGAISMSGVNIGGQVTFLITNAIFGLSVGATVLIAQYLGAGDRKSLTETIGTLFTTLLCIAAVLTVVMVAVEEPLLRLIKTPAESFDEARRYFFITMLGTVFIFGYNALSAVMRGMGDSKRPLWFVSIACVTNIFLDLLLVGKFNMGASGAAIATVISQAISMILCILYLMKNKFVFDFKLKSFGFHPERLKLLLKIGIPTTVQNIAVSTSFLFLTAIVNSIGYIESAAVGAVGKLNSFAILPAVAMSSSISAMCAQNIGAGHEKRALKTLKVGMIISIVISVFIFVLIRLFPDFWLSLFCQNEQMEAAGREYISTFSFDYLFAPIAFSLNGLFIGSGHSVVSLISNAISAILVRIPIAYIFGILLDMGLSGAGLCGPISSGISVIFGLIYFFSGKWKKRTIIVGSDDNPPVLDA